MTTAYEANQPKGEQTFYRYEVDISPELSKPKRRQLISQIVQDSKFSGKPWATDYGRIIVTTSKLDLGKTNEWSKKLTVAPPNGNSNENGQLPAQQGPTPPFVNQARARNTVTFKVTYIGSYNLRDLIDYLRSESSGGEYAGRGDLIQMLNIMVGKPPNGSSTVTNVGQNTFFPSTGHPGMEAYDLGSGLVALRGYFASVRPAVGRLLLNLNVSSGAFFKPIHLINLMQEFQGSAEQREAFLRMLKVKAVYVKDGQSKSFMEKTKTIVGFAKELTPPTFRVPRFGNAKQVTFQYTDQSIPNAQPQAITVLDYFRRQHDITLKRPELPVLNVGTRADPQYLPAELCTVIPGQPYRHLLQSEQTSEMIKFAARPPNLNAMSIAGTAETPGNGLRLFRLADPSGQGNPQVTSVQPFGFRVGTSMITVPARILNSPQVRYGPTGQQSPNVNRGSWNLVNMKFAQGGRFNRWQALVINIRGPRGSALNPNASGEMMGPEALFDELGRQLASYQVRMGQRARTQTVELDPLTPANRNSNNRKLTAVFEKAEEESVQMLFVVLPAYDQWLYARVKYYGDVLYGIHTINAIGSKFQKPKGQGMYMGNLALKFNIKGGGRSHVVPGTLAAPLSDKTMFFGIDVTHPSPGSTEGAPSIACVVANTDQYLMQWPGSIRPQTGKKEMVEGLKTMVLERLRLWRNKHGSLPTKIVIYRDGVSEGQFRLVLEQELPFFEAAYEEAYGARERWPKTAIIIVGKRHHTRFYPTRQQDADVNLQTGRGSWNTQPGTIVDRGITGKIIRDFYLQPHQGLQGTVRPAHYSVIKDDVGFSADQLESLTHKLCYHFVRCTKAVSICPPAYYADLLAERGRAYLFSTLQENHGSDSSAFDGGSAEWTGGVHERLRESTWYI